MDPEQDYTYLRPRGNGKYSFCNHFLKRKGDCVHGDDCSFSHNLADCILEHSLNYSGQRNKIKNKHIFSAYQLLRLKFEDFDVQICDPDVNFVLFGKGYGCKDDKCQKFHCGSKKWHENGIKTSEVPIQSQSHQNHQGQGQVPAVPKFLSKYYQYIVVFNNVVYIDETNNMQDLINLRNSSHLMQYPIFLFCTSEPKRDMIHQYLKDLHTSLDHIYHNNFPRILNIVTLVTQSPICHVNDIKLPDACAKENPGFSEVPDNQNPQM